MAMVSVADMIARAKADLLRTAKDRATNAASALIAATPGRSGRTRCSFVAALNAVPTDTDPRRRGAAIDPSGQPALDQIQATIERLKPGDTVVVVSDFRNAWRQEEGTRKYPGRPMVEAAVTGFQSEE